MACITSATHTVIGKDDMGQPETVVHTQDEAAAQRFARLLLSEGAFEAEVCQIDPEDGELIPLDSIWRT